MSETPATAIDADVASAGVPDERIVHDVRRRLHVEPPTAPQVLLAGALIGWTWYFTTRSMDIHHGLGTATYDSALYDQGLWLLSRFDAPFVTLMGRNLFGDHASFILVVLVPFYWVAPGAWIIFTAQSAALALGALPVFLYGRRRLGSEWLALVGAGVYLLHPAVGWTNLENFHPDAFLGVFVGFAIYAALERKWRMYATFVVLSLLVKEDVSLVAVPLGVWVALRRDRRIGVATIAASLAAMAIAMLLVMRSLIGVPTRNAWRIPFGGVSGLLRTALTDPGELVSYLRSDGRPWYLVQMTAPFAWLFARLPDVAMISALVLFTNVVSTYSYQYQVEYHYSLIAVPALVIGTVYAIGAIGDRPATRRGRVVTLLTPRRAAIGVLAVATMLTAYLWSPMPWGSTTLYYGDPDGHRAAAARQLFAEIPDGAVVSANYRLTPHLAYRREIYQFPVPFSVELYGVDDRLKGTRLAERAERVDYVMLPIVDDPQVAAEWREIESAFVEVDRNDVWVLYQRDSAVPLPSVTSGVRPPM